MRIDAIIWDYDGTLVDTGMKNFNVTKTLISEITKDLPEKYPVLNSFEKYLQANNNSANWRELYRSEFGFDEKQIDYVGNLWTKFQLLDKTKVDLFGGISNAVSKLKNYPQGIVSQNSSENIKSALERFDLKKYFQAIIGYEEVDLSKQKPNAEGLLTCIAAITNSDSKTSVIYIGDHQTDIQCAYNANYILNRKAVISILINYNKINPHENWSYKPDYYATNPGEIVDIIENIIV